MALARRVVGGLVFLLMLASLPAFAARRGDTGTSQNGSFGGCGEGSTCVYLGLQNTATLSGKDQSGNTVTVTIDLYDWGYYPCGDSQGECQSVTNAAVLDVTLTGTDSAGIESLVVKGTLSNPGYVSCQNFQGGIGIACIYSPEPDSNGDVQEPTPIAGADHGSTTNTRWDFGGLPPLSPPPPAVPFDQLSCANDENDAICAHQPFPLGEAILTVANSVAQNKLGTSSSSYLVTLTDGTTLGTLAVPKSPAKQVAKTNNTQSTATVISKTTYKDYTDASQAYPQINSDGTEQYPQGFTPLPLTNPPPCNPNGDNRTFRTAWYTYTAPSNGSITISTADSRYDTLIYVFTGSASSPTVISCDDDPFPGGGLLQATTSFNVTKGTNYQIMVGETPTYLENGAAYPLSVDSILYFSFKFSTSPVKIASATSLTSSPNPSVFEQPVELLATVIVDGSGTPTGTVTFTDGSTNLGSSSLSGGKASLSTSALPVGVNSIAATYSGDSNFSGSTSAPLSQVVMAATTTTLTSSPNPSKFSSNVTFTATVTSPAGTPTGSVQFLNGTTLLKQLNLVSGVATFTTSQLPLGSDIITAVYSGDSNDLGSTSAPLNQVVLLYTLTILHSFAGGPDGAYPVASLVQDSSGNFYGTASQAGDLACNGGYGAGSGCGTVFKLDPTGKETVLYSFTGTGGDGAIPWAGLVRAAQGNLYGTTSAGGDLACPNGNGYGCGTVFKLDTTGKETVLHSFTGTGGDGAFPEAGLLLDAQGNLYGTTAQGGDLGCPDGFGYGCGIVFQITNGQETVLHSFTGSGGDGAFPQAGLIEDAQANLYGTTSEGGNSACYYGCGTVFKLAATGQETVLYAFTGAGDGGLPYAGLLQDAQGNLYGTTIGGGASSNGTVFKVTPAGAETVLHSFTGTGGDGASPNAGLVLGAHSNLYGTTSYGGDLACDPNGPGCGNVFRVSTTGKETPLYNFTGAGGDGAFPYAGVLRDAQGNLYGTTYSGGANGFGMVFKLTPF